MEAFDLLPAYICIESDYLEPVSHLFHLLFVLASSKHVAILDQASTKGDGESSIPTFIKGFGSKF